MKPLAMLLIFVAMAAAVVANALSPAGTQGPPDLQIVKFSWSKERLGWERDPFSGPIENFDEMRVRSRNEKRIDDAKRGGNSTEADRIKREAKADSAILEQQRRQTPPRYGFMYKLLVRNTGTKAIKLLDWDHVFFDPASEAEIGRHQFTGDEKIGSGKQREFSVFISAPPSRTVSVDKLIKGERDSIGQHIVIMRIQYTDGSVWQRP